MLKFAITIVTKNCLDYTKACIKSIRSAYDYYLIIIDDGSTDGTNRWVETELKEQYKDKLVFIKELDEEASMSLAGKWNMATEKAKELGLEANLICNNDILFHRMTVDSVVERLKKGLNNEENIAVVSAANQRGGIEPSKLDSIEVGEGSEANSPDFSCFLLNIDIWEKVGRFDTSYIPCYFEDNDFHITLAKSGYKAIMTTRAPYYHFGSVTQNSVPGGLCPGIMFESNRDYFESKWGFSVGSNEYNETISRAGALISRYGTHPAEGQ